MSYKHIPNNVFASVNIPSCISFDDDDDGILVNTLCFKPKSECEKGNIQIALPILCNRGSLEELRDEAIKNVNCMFDYLIKERDSNE